MKKQPFLYTRLTIVLSVCFLMIGLVGCTGDSSGDRSASDDDLLTEADIIIQEGRVIDPETGRDEIAINV